MKLVTPPVFFKKIEKIVADYSLKKKMTSFSVAWEDIGSNNKEEKTYALLYEYLERLRIFY